MLRRAALSAFVVVFAACADPVEPGPDATTGLDATAEDVGVSDAGASDAATLDTGALDAGPADLGTPDAGFRDAEPEDLATPDAGFPDAEPPDLGTPDAGFPDAEPLDLGTPDTGPPDLGAPDTGPADLGVPDLGPPDLGVPDAGFPDSGPVDTGAPDTGVADAGPPDSGAQDAGALDAGPMLCTVTPNSCPNQEVCLGESCSCILAMHGQHYLRTDGTVVNWSSSVARVVTTTAGASLDRVTEIFSGSGHGCGLRDDGTVWCWPTSSIGNRNGQLGNGATTSNVPPAAHYMATRVLVSAGVGLTGALHINGGSSRGYIASNSCAVMSNGNLYCWGSPDASGGGGGTLFNDGVPGNRPYATAILASANTPMTGVDAVSVGIRHACVIRDGATPDEVWCWGANVGGPLGQGNQTARTYPVQVTLPGPAAQVGSGSDATCARVAGGVYCWGSSGSGQIGLGDYTLPGNHNGCINYCRLTPAAVVDSNGAALTTVVDYNMGYLSSCAKLADHSLWCWGRRGNVAQSNSAVPAVVGTTTLNNVARFTTDTSNGYGTALRFLNRDNALYRATQLVTPVCP